MLFTVYSTGWFYRKPYSTVVLKLHTIKFAKKENSSLFMNSVLQNRITRVEHQTKTRVWEDSSLCSETSIKTTVQEFHTRLAQLPNIKPASAWAYHRVPTFPPFFLYRQVKAGRSHRNYPLPPQRDRRAIHPNHIKFRTCSALARMWTHTILKLTQLSHYSVGLTNKRLMWGS